METDDAAVYQLNEQPGAVADHRFFHADRR